MKRNTVVNSILHGTERSGKREINKIKSYVLFPLSLLPPYNSLIQSKNQGNGKYSVNKVILTK